MLLYFVALALASAASAKEELAAKQLLQYANEHKEPAYLTTSYGYPVTYEEANLGINRDSNLLLNHYIYESMSSFSSERIPPRGVHSNGGAGGYGYFEVTHDVSNITNVKFFNTIGKRTPFLARFSTGTGEKGASEVKERNKALSFKFYTEEGNMDLLGITSDVFLLKDPSHAGSGTRALKNNPKTGLLDPAMSWDFAVNHPESILGLTEAVSFIGQRKSYRFADYHAIHTFQVENDKGEVSFIRLNWFPEAGIQSLTNEEYVALSGADPDMHSQDLYDAISNKTYPTWIIKMQVVPKKDLDKVKFDIFDITMYWPEECFPNIPIGKAVINKHVENWFAELEQAAFNPGNLVPGIRGMDKMFEARMFIYRDGAIHRMGTGYNRIKVNCPINMPQTYNRDGSPPLGDNGGESPNYYPNSFHGIVPVNKTLSPLYRPNTKPDVTNLWQVADFFNRASDIEKKSMVALAGASIAGAPKSVQDKVLKIYAQADPKIAAAIKVAIDTVTAAAAAAAKATAAQQ